MVRGWDAIRVGKADRSAGYKTVPPPPPEPPLQRDEFDEIELRRRCVVGTTRGIEER